MRNCLLIATCAAALIHMSTLSALADVITNETTVSGRSSDQFATVSVTKDDAGISGVTTKKYLGLPCYLSIDQQEINSAATNELTLNACPANTLRVSKHIGFDQPGQFVRGIAICLSRKTTNSYPRLAGVKITGAAVENGTVTPLPEGSNLQFQRSTCNAWQEMSTCADGKIANGVTAYFRRSGGFDYEIIGLSLTCQTLSI